MLKASPVDYYTQAEVARMLRWSRQRVWLALHTRDIQCVQTRGDIAAVLVTEDGVAKMKAEDRAPSAPRVKKAKSKRRLLTR